MAERRAERPREPVEVPAALDVEDVDAATLGEDERVLGEGLHLQEDGDPGDLGGGGDSPQRVLGLNLRPEGDRIGVRLEERAVELGVDVARADGVRPDAVPAVGHGDALRVADDRRLRRSINGKQGVGGERVDRRQVDDHARPPFDHRRQDLPAEEDAAEEVDAHDLVEVLDPDVGREVLLLHGRIVDQHVDTPVLVEDATHDRPDLLLVRHVAVGEPHTPTGGHDLGGGRPSLLVEHVHAEDAGTLPRVRGRDRPPDPARRAGDDRHPFLEPSVHVSTPVLRVAGARPAADVGASPMSGPPRSPPPGRAPPAPGRRRRRSRGRGSP